MLYFLTLSGGHKYARLCLWRSEDTGGSQCFPSTVGIPGVELRSSDLSARGFNLQSHLPPPHRPPELVKCMSFSFLAKQQNGLLCEIIQ